MALVRRRLRRRRAARPSRRCQRALAAALAPLQRASYEPWRLINTYHLFGHITRERIEPRVPGRDGRRTGARSTCGTSPATRAARPTSSRRTNRASTSSSGSTASAFEHGTPAYVSALLDRLCRDPAAVQALFRDAAARRPDGGAHRVLAVPLHAPEETGAWWTRELSRPLGRQPCRAVAPAARVRPTVPRGCRSETDVSAAVRNGALRRLLRRRRASSEPRIAGATRRSTARACAPERHSSISAMF